jgi:hypothetical protein
MSSWTATEWVTFFTAAGGFVVLIATQISGLIVSIRNGTKLDTSNALGQKTHDMVDGQTKALIKVTGDASFAAGQKDQVDRQTTIQTAVDAARKEP